MKLLVRKSTKKKNIDDSLFGLLLPYKSFNTYFRILINESEKKISFQMTDNPKNWDNISIERYSAYRILSRIELSSNVLFVKYIEPKHLIHSYGEFLGIKLPKTRISVENFLNDSEKKYYLIDANLRHLTVITQRMRKLINLSPQKKYGIIEKFFADNINR